MTHVITANQIDMKSIQDYVDNFIIVHMSIEEVYVGVKPFTKYVFDIYHQDGMSPENITDDEDAYISNHEFKYNFHPVPAVASALDRITRNIIQKEQNYADDNGEELSDISSNTSITIAIESEIARLFRKYIKNLLTENNHDIEIVDILQYMSMTKLSKFTESMKQVLGTEFIYQDDPISFSYAVSLIVSGER